MAITWRKAAGFCIMFVAASAHLTAGSPAGLITFNDDGGWCWFEDERAIVHKGKLIAGSVAAGTGDKSRKGNIELAVYDLASGRKTIVPLHERLLTKQGVYDDHNSPALLVRPDGRLLSIYAMHGQENKFYYRISETSDPSGPWMPEQTFVPSESSRITYSNLYYLKNENGGKGRVYDFYRGLDGSFKPSFVYSDDYGDTWRGGNVVIDVPGKFKHRPYVRYASNGTDTVHLFYTEGHPRNFDNSTYHVFYKAGKLHRSDGSVIRALSEGLKEPEEGTRIFKGDAENVGWLSDIHLDEQGRPYVAYSDRKAPAEAGPDLIGEDHRYRYARWTGDRWLDYEIAFAGSQLYRGEDDYTGNIALDPDDPNTVYISANVEPVSGKPLISKADDRRHWEIFRGRTADRGKTWKWTPVTTDSDRDNIRPIVPKWDKNNLALLWLQGRYTTYTNFDLKVVGLISSRGKTR